ncbi:AFR524Wp [Eremothecium gossypii ATCC 10895]|uniref:AFR524Wp n=1 Tax=Eremothecium gossypii (strain ATCC 10895 / CBS 109.51 / FGSC 9923 / NRRL Y-1056) TaxID=284811 RepID=Q752P9_EREGS|nr:AFR524Wp [Eremothecium gossypii ATCC 10895]AAS53895.1 AFR524Wp [Eremothecium gossypii ATCC 10895]AEY98208.1 FAFR524Wp [Eremothecium gossypii FDAG1]
MPFLSTIEANVTGAFSELSGMSPSAIAQLVLKTLTIALYMFVYGFWSTFAFVFDCTLRSDSVDQAITVGLRMITIVPVIGSPLGRRLSLLVKLLKTELLPFLDEMVRLTEYAFHVKMINDTICGDNVKIIVTGDPFSLDYVEAAPLTSVIISNHRSVIDYAVISKLVLETQERIPNHNKFLMSTAKKRRFVHPPPFRFLTWAKITNFPTLSLFFNIWSKDENSIVSATTIHSHLMKHRNTTFVLFPEVNSITPELVMIQQKLLKSKYEDTPSLKQVLYPRYKQFNSLVKDLACWKKVKKRNSIMEKVVDRLDKWIHDDDLLDQDLIELESFLTAEEDAAATQRSSNVEQIRINEFMYNLTIVYYQPVLKCNDPDHIHEHNHAVGIKDPHYQLEHITPSLWDMYRAQEADQPIVIRVHIDRHRMDPLLQMKSRHVEKWLENYWCEKDKQIAVMDTAVKLK